MEYCKRTSVTSSNVTMTMLLAYVKACCFKYYNMLRLLLTITLHLSHYESASHYICRMH